MTPPPLVAVVNRSAHLLNADAEQMVHAIGRQMAEHASPFYTMPALEYVMPGGKPSAGACLCELLDQPDLDAALGYHSEYSTGIPYAKVFVPLILSYGGGVLKPGSNGDLSVSTVLSHELLELAVDAPANMWVDGNDNVFYAKEVGDPVESQSYEIDGVAVSNFVLPAFFDPVAEKGSKLDYLGKLTRPLTLAPGGYMITRSAGATKDVWGARRIACEGDQGASSVVEVSNGLVLHFGPAMPEWKRAGKVRKAELRVR